VTGKPEVILKLALMLGNAPEDDGSGVLDFHALLQELRVSVPKLHIVQSIFSSPARLYDFFSPLAPYR
jgi:hypothetical protein